ncbi:glycosyltransferase family 2 protein [Brachybacterium alimentarium]|uniref:glycosyltransferase family 2 protein n=1 Tax=Brachybacterium alimentarium TaxID=47845 RepID=UPI003FD51F34
MNSDTVMERPLVSVIIPVYNVEDFVKFTLDSTLNQGLAEGQLEVICIDDGSTDNSGRILDDYASRFDFFRVMHQENSGGPGNPRNNGMGISRGKYLFFLDADDELTENALRDLVRTAETEGADVVLGKGEGLNGRVVPGPVFRTTRLDADLIDDNVYRTLSPWKLFRKSLIEHNNIRFLETLSIGEDQPFVASAYLNSRKISVLADRPYARLRARGDGTNVTATPRSVNDYLELAKAIVSVIVAESEPGRVRDGMLGRPMKRTLRPVVGKKFLGLDGTEQQAVVLEISQLMSGYYNDAVAAHLEGLDRLKMDLAVAGRAEPLARIVQWEIENPASFLTVDSEGIRFDLPDDIVDQVGDPRLRDVNVTTEVTLKSFDVCEQVVTITGDASVVGLATHRHDVSLFLQGRKTGAALTFPADRPDAGRAVSGNGNGAFVVSFETIGLADDVWDLRVVQTIGGVRHEKRLGSQRSPSLQGDRGYIYRDGTLRGILYFTKGAGFLACDLGLQIAAHRLPQAQVVGVTLEDPVRARFLVSAPGVTSVAVRADLLGTDASLTGSTPVVQLSDDLYEATVEWKTGHDVRVLIDVSNGVSTAPAASACGLKLPVGSEGRIVSGSSHGAEEFVLRRDIPPESPAGAVRRRIRAARARWSGRWHKSLRISERERKR